MLIRGRDLTARQRAQVLDAFVHRNTVEFPAAGGRGNKTDAEYIAEHAFYFVKDGSRLDRKHRFCETDMWAAGLASEAS